MVIATVFPQDTRSFHVVLAPLDRDDKTVVKHTLYYKFQQSWLVQLTMSGLSFQSWEKGQRLPLKQQLLM